MLATNSSQARREEVLAPKLDFTKNFARIDDSTSSVWLTGAANSNFGELTALLSIAQADFPGLQAEEVTIKTAVEGWSLTFRVPTSEIPDSYYEWKPLTNWASWL